MLSVSEEEICKKSTGIREEARRFCRRGAKSTTHRQNRGDISSRSTKMQQRQIRQKKPQNQTKKSQKDDG